MDDPTRDVLQQALDLPADARAVLATELIASLQADSPDDPEAIEREWAEEITRRLRDVLEGRVLTVPFEEAIARARKALAEVRRNT